MGIKERKLIDRFTAQSNDGRQHELLVYQEVLDASSMGNPQATVEGLKTIVTSQGHDVTRIDDLNYEIVELRTRVKRIDR